MKKWVGLCLMLCCLLWWYPANVGAEGMSVYPVPTGKWEGEDVELTVLYDGNYTDINWASSGYRLSSTMQPPAGFLTNFSLPGKIILDQNGEFYVHVELLLKNGTTVKHTIGPYKIMNTPLGNFTMKITNPSGREATSWTKEPVYLTMSYSGNEVNEGIIRQYKIKGVHDDWQMMNEVNGDGIIQDVKLVQVGKQEVITRVVNKAGKVSATKSKTYQLDESAVEFQHISLKQKEDGTYHVLVWATDDYSGVESVSVETPSGKKTLQKSPMSSVYKVDDLLDLPTNVVAKDKAGNEIKEPFLEKPTISFTNYDPTNDLQRENIDGVVAGSYALSYTIDAKKVACAASSCPFTMTKNGLLTASQVDGIKQTSIEVRIGNLDKRDLQLHLQGQRYTAKEMTFNWNYELEAGATLTCFEGEKKRVFSVENKTATIRDAVNVKYTCTVEGAYKGETLISNTVHLYSDPYEEVPVGSNYQNEPLPQLVFVEESRIGMSYFININRSNVDDNRAKIPLGVFP